MTPRSTERDGLVAARIKELDLTFGAVAARIERYSRGHLRPDQSLVWRWAKSQSRPSPSYLDALCAVLQLDPEAVRRDIDTAYVSRKQHAREKRHEHRVVDFNRSAVSIGISDESTNELIRRRDVLKGGAFLISAGADTIASALSSELMGLAAAIGRSHVSPAALQALQTVTEHHAHNIWRYNYFDVGQTLMEYLRNIGRLLDSPLSVKERAELCLRGCQLSAMLGQTTFEIGHHTEARMHFNNAFHLAQEIDHHYMMAWVSCVETQLLVAWGAHSDALKLIQSAKEIASGGVLVELLASEALIAAAASDSASGVRTISALEKSIDKATSIQSPSPTYYMFGFSEAAANLRLAQSWIVHNQPHTGFELARRAHDLTRWNKKSEQGQAKFMMAWARALEGEPDEAVSLATDVLALRPQNVYVFKAQSEQLIQTLSKQGCHRHARALLDASADYRRQDTV